MDPRPYWSACKKLYTKPNSFPDDKYNAFLNGVTLPRFTKLEKLQCDHELEITEIGKALSQLKNESSPGSDGLTAAWYKMFWQKIKNKCI